MSTENPGDPTEGGGRRNRLVTDLIAALRGLNREAVLYSDAVAGRLGMPSSDVECLEVLITSGPTTAGGLAEVTGLSTGAVTRMIDRLEQAGFVRRVADPADRRRVIVEAVKDRTAAVSSLFSEMQHTMETAMERYSDDHLASVLDFITGALDLARAETARVRETPMEAPGGWQVFAAPLGGVTTGRLVFMSGFSDLVLGVDPKTDRLFSSRFAGSPPRVRVRGGVVSIRASEFPVDWLNPKGQFEFTASVPFNFDFRRGLGKVKADVSPRVEFRNRGVGDTRAVKARGEVLLNSTIPWDIDVRGGLSRLTADLRGIDLASLDISGGVSTATVDLPRPRGWASLRLISGASDVAFLRPAGVPIRLRVHGGVSGLDLDDQHFSSIGGGDVRLESRGSSGASAGYTIEIIGGASRVRIGSDAETEATTEAAPAPSTDAGETG